MITVRNLAGVFAVANAIGAVCFYVAAGQACVSGDLSLCDRFAMASVIHGITALGVMIAMRAR